MSRVGRPNHNFWENGSYERRKEGKKIVAYCLICKKYLANTAKTRLQLHRNVCKNETDWLSQSQQSENFISTDNNENVIETIELANSQAVSNTVDTIILSSDDQRISKSKVIAIGAENASEVPILSDFDISTSTPVSQEFSSVTSTTIPPCPKRLKTMQPLKHKLNSYIDYISIKQKARIDDTLVKFFYGCNIPFKVVESKLFLNFVNAIRPAYTPLSAAAMSNEILHDLHTELGKYQSTFFHCEGILIITRIEIKQTSHDFIGFVQNQGKTIYIKTWDIEKGDINLSSIINEAVTLANTKFKIKIYAVITDEDVQLINIDECSKLWILQCNIYFASSIEKELVDLSFAEKVRYLLGQFSSKKLEKDLTTRGGVILKLENNSFYHNCDLFAACLKNLRAMTQMMGDRQHKFKKEVIDILIDESFEEELNHSLDLLKPVCCIIEKCEKSEITIADIVEDWLILASAENYNSFQLQINAILTPITLVANVLHPIYRGQRFTNDQACMRKVMEFLINELDEEGMNDFTKYKNLTGIFNSHRLKNYTNGQTFWQAVAPVHPKLSSFAIKVLQLPAAVPKLKSYPNNLNNLTPNRFEKLTDLFYYLNM